MFFSRFARGLHQNLVCTGYFPKFKMPFSFLHHGNSQEHKQAYRKYSKNARTKNTLWSMPSHKNWKHFEQRALPSSTSPKPVSGATCLLLEPAPAPSTTTFLSPFCHGAAAAEPFLALLELLPLRNLMPSVCAPYPWAAAGQGQTRDGLTSHRRCELERDRED